MEPKESSPQPGNIKTDERILELEQELEQLREENAVLRAERDRAVKAQDALLDKVIPLAIPGNKPEVKSSSTMSRLFTLLICVMLLIVLVIMAHYFPRITRALSNNQPLPPAVRVQQPEKQ